MSTGQQHGEPERKEGLGGRVRRFVDTELSRVLDSDDRSTDQGATAHRRESGQAAEFDRSTESGRTYESSRPAGVDRTHELDRSETSDRPYESERATYQEPVTTPAAAGPADPAMTTAAVDPGYDSTTLDDRSKETGSKPHYGRSSDQTAADAGAERVGLLNDPASLREQWQQVQGTFVDDPPRAVREASQLVQRTLQEIQANVTRGQAGDPTSTEDLRVSFQRYREFFHRLLSA
jgi:hypothetical protein